MILDIGSANREAGMDKYIIHGFGPRAQLGKVMLLAYGTALLEVAPRTKGLRKAPGQMRRLETGAGAREKALHDC